MADRALASAYIVHYRCTQDGSHDIILSEMLLQNTHFHSVRYRFGQRANTERCAETAHRQNFEMNEENIMNYLF